MKRSRSEANRMLWLLKASWLNRESVEQQRAVHQMVSDWLEEQGRLDESQLLRGDSWWMYFYPGADEYRLIPRLSEEQANFGWLVFWWPCPALGQEGAPLNL